MNLFSKIRLALIDSVSNICVLGSLPESPHLYKPLTTLSLAQTCGTRQFKSKRSALITTQGAIGFLPTEDLLDQSELNPYLGKFMPKYPTASADLPMTTTSNTNRSEIFMYPSTYIKLICKCHINFQHSYIQIGGSLMGEFHLFSVNTKKQMPCN